MVAIYLPWEKVKGCTENPVAMNARRIQMSLIGPQSVNVSNQLIFLTTCAGRNLLGLIQSLAWQYKQFPPNSWEIAWKRVEPNFEL